MDMSGGMGAFVLDAGGTDIGIARDRLRSLGCIYRKAHLNRLG
jgi:hypothetical protein